MKRRIGDNRSHGNVMDKFTFVRTPWEKYKPIDHESIVDGICFEKTDLCLVKALNLGRPLTEPLIVLVIGKSSMWRSYDAFYCLEDFMAAVHRLGMDRVYVAAYNIEFSGTESTRGTVGGADIVTLYDVFYLDRITDRNQIPRPLSRLV